MKQLSLDNLRTFVSVIELGGYAKAGDFLGRSQPAISLQIKKLETQLDKKLFTKWVSDMFLAPTAIGCILKLKNY